MEEKDIIGKIEELKEIKPSKNWVFSAKKEIFREGSYVTHAKPGFSFNFFMKPAFVFAVLSIAVLATGFVFYSSSLDGLRNAQDKYDEKVAEFQEIAPALESLQASLSQAKESLNNTRISDPREVLEVGKNIDSVVKEGEKVLRESKGSDETSTGTAGIAGIQEDKEEEKTEGETYASINEIERAVEELEESYKSFVGKVINDVSHWYLGPSEQEKLEKAREYYENEEYNRALEMIYSISYPEYQVEE